MTKRITTIICILCFLSVQLLSARSVTAQRHENQMNSRSDKPIRAVLLNPGGSHWFWKMTIDFMQAAAADLNIELEVVTSDYNHLLTIEQAKEIVARANPPDYIITGNEKSNAGEIIRIADEAGVKIFLFSNGFVDPKDKQEYGNPREKFPFWIGELIPNNYSAGYTMGKMLIDEALHKNLRAVDGKINIVAIAGAYLTHASEERLRGLNDAMAEYPDTVQLLQVFHGDWTYDKAVQLSQGVFRRYPKVQILWGANDTTALGAMDVAASLGMRPGQNILFGGCGWYEPALQKVEEGKLTTSVGGHFMEGGWVMVMLNDYHHGIDFIDDPWKTSMFSIDATNVGKYLQIFGKQDWRQIDFRKFSKAYTPALKRYDFSLEAVIQQIESQKPQ
ncbi:ABC transporter substrate-binding protein [Desulfopila aestuarii]|uniref:Monosaccharide ABC transporter substrate-binding protein, CUT2 family n=1 Tax=Desulfopila aestuarii DSM 18488 TaxID=1121416 RepID=A0A1M7YAR3_9BACT|nr:ABC transporter substrate-binding protein [Desulfopila aestuarii]SHO49666.1 monosaccharide ABC transporter substrate-binding protein, CUT2 family [Desulfopila aestuarii DSM 18488]